MKERYGVTMIDSENETIRARCSISRNTMKRNLDWVQRKIFEVVSGGSLHVGIHILLHIERSV